MSDHIQHAASDSIKGHPTGNQKLGRNGKIFVFGVVPFIAAAIFAQVAPAIANATDGSTDVVHLTPAKSNLGSQVPPTPIVIGNDCKIRVVGQGTPNSRIVIQQLFDSAPAYTRGYVDVDKNGMIQKARMHDDHIPGYDRGVRIQLSTTQFDDGAALEPVLTVLVVNDVNSGCPAQ